MEYKRPQMSDKQKPAFIDQVDLLADRSPLAGQARIHPLLITKLTLPPQQTHLLERQSLGQRLSEARQQTLTILSAPAGFGKTTLLAGWAAMCGEHAAWISLDPTENDPLLFWSYVAAACQQVLPNLERLVTPVFQQPGPLDVEALLTVLINALAHASSQLFLILDDYHVIITQEIHQQMTFLIEHAPATLHLILSTRTDPPFPLARFRARQTIYELRTLDLRFSEEETLLFLQQELGITLPTQVILDVIEQKLEGWPAGLHLLALSLKKRPDPLQWLLDWNGQQQHLATYLIEEVLLQQTTEIQEFLLCTSLLPRLTGSLCDALLERSDGVDVLEMLARANLFLTPLDEEHTWYRYHHLFAQVLKHRLYRRQDKERIAQLCRRASTWYLQHNQVLDAVEMTILAEDYTEAANLLEQQGLPIAQGYPYTRFIAWIKQFPPSILIQHPNLANWYASALMMLGQLDQLHVAGETAARGFEAQGNLSSLGTMLAFNAIRHYWTGDHAAFTRLREQAVLLLTEHAPEAGLALTILNGFAAFQQGQALVARPLFDTWLRFHEQNPTFTGYMAGCTMCSADIWWLQGQLHKAVPLYQQVMERAKALPFPISEVHFRWSKVLLEWNRLDEAEAFLQLALQAARRMQHTKLLSLGATQQARLLLARGKREQAEQALREASHLASQHPYQVAQQEALLEEGRLLLLQDNKVAFEDWCARVGITSESSPTFAQEQVALLLARWLIAHQQADLAMAFLPAWREAARESGRDLVVMQCSLIQALAHATRQEYRPALDLLAQTVQRAELGGFVRLFLNEGLAMREMLTMLAAKRSMELPYLQTLLAAFPQSVCPPVPDTEHTPAFSSRTDAPHGPLSPREEEILRLIAQGATNEEIAAQLVIAYTTVKRHVSTILSKLDATNRTQAVAIAREQGWLSSEM